MGAAHYPSSLFCGRFRANKFAARLALKVPAVICLKRKSLPHVALAILCACAPAFAQNSHRRRAEAPPTGAGAPVVFLDSTRERDGLKGPVRRVETEVVRVERRGGALVEKSRSVLERTLYDETGRRVENETYPVVSATAGRESHSYDAQGNLSETVVRDERGAVLSRTIYAYEFDPFGNWVKMTASVAVVSAGQFAYEPFEVTNRAITYYATGDGNAAAPSTVNPPAPAAANPPAPPRDAERAAHDARQARVPAPRAEAEPKRKGERVAHAGAREVRVGAREIEVGVLNDRATSLPRPSFPVTSHRLDEPINVSVEVLVDETGLVVEASAPEAPPTLRQAAEDAARRATFFPFYSQGRPVRARGRLNFGFYFSP